MPPFSPAQSASVPMKTRLKMKLNKIMQSERNDRNRVKARVECVDGCEETSLKRSVSSPSLRALNSTTWSKGRGKGGKKLGNKNPYGLIKDMPEKGFKEWTKMLHESTQRLLEKRKENSMMNSSSVSAGGSPALQKSKSTKRVFGH